MGSRRRLAQALLAQAAVAGLAVAALLAVRAGLPASALAAGLLAGFAALAVAVGASRERVRVIEAPQPRRADDEARNLRLLLDHSPAPLVTLEPDGVIRAVNRAARALFGVDDRILRAAGLREALQGATVGGRSTLQLGEGAPARTYSISVVDVSTRGGGARLAALVDIGGELRAAEAAALREMLNVLSHELMNSLTPITSLAQTAHELLADSDAPAREAGLDALRTIARRAQGIDGFVRAYRDLARLPDPALRPVRLVELLEEAARLFRARWPAEAVRLELALAPEAGSLCVAADAQQLLQAVLNLLTNAAEAAAEAAKPMVALSLDVDALEAMIRVEDNGPGVSAAHCADLFRPFFTTKPQGSGVGLSLARSIARSHGGDLQLQKTKSGARFVLSLARLCGSPS